jgi:hypothetical protein
LQNADDNLYDLKASGEAPYVSFQMRSDRIIVECNEKGFTEKNLISICNIGQSSKAGSHRHIGKKGTGFKSVFKVAYKVLIQSGNFSFSFTHRKGDSGMGMISPHWEDRDDAPSGAITRTTLFLHEDDNDHGLRSSIQEQFEALNEEILLFTRRLKKIDIKIYDGTGNLSSSTTYSAISSIFSNRATTEKMVQKHGNTKVERRYFHITRQMVANLPLENENRDYSKTEFDFAASEIVLAFPLSEDSIPILEPQWVFAFMPICRMGFNVGFSDNYVDPTVADLTR